VKVRVLGTAAGGGLPQWNCNCPGCAAARDGTGTRTQDCLAVSGDGVAWYLINAGPDIRTQILSAPELTPGPGRRQTPLRGALLTSAELDHTLGLAALREATDFTVYATPSVLQALPFRGAIEPYGGIRWSAVGPSRLDLAGGLSVETIPLGRKRPRYAAGAPDADDWVVGYRLTGHRTGGVLVYAPCLAEWSPALDAALLGAGCVLLDGSFYTDAEMTEQTGGGSSSRDMGHLPICDSLTYRSRHPPIQWLYTHLNNTNPALVETSPQRRALRQANADVATDGMLLAL
jgi:pyrroloquinoline quinone biosynthesis protein B